MKIAFLITAYSNYSHLLKLIDALAEGENTFYVHIDKKSKLPEDLIARDRVKLLHRINVWWGGWSHQAAILELMKESSKGTFDYYVLLSGTDYPIRPNKFLYDKLEEGGEYINIIKGFQSHKPERRIKNFHFDNFDRRDLKSRRTRFFLFLERKIRRFYTKEDYPFSQIYHGSTWWALSQRTVGYILDFTENNPDFVNFFKTSWCPEEAYIPTIIGNSPILKECKTNLTYTDWDSEPAPAVLNREHIELFEKKSDFEGVYGIYKPFFARKFTDHSSELIQEIEARLR